MTAWPVGEPEEKGEPFAIDADGFVSIGQRTGKVIKTHIHYLRWMGDDNIPAFLTWDHDRKPVVQAEGDTYCFDIPPPPRVKGGQGRTANEMERDALIILALAFAAMATITLVLA